MALSLSNVAGLNDIRILWKVAESLPRDTATLAGRGWNPRALKLGPGTEEARHTSFPLTPHPAPDPIQVGLWPVACGRAGGRGPREAGSSPQ